MIILDVDGSERKIPQKYSEITVKEFKGLWNILYSYDDEEDDEIKKAEMEKKCSMEIVAHLLGIDKKQAYQIDYMQGQKVLNLFNTMLESEKFSDDYEGHSFIHNDEVYYFPKHTLDELTFGEYSEVKTIEALLNKNIADKFNFINRQMAILCKKYKEKKDDYDLDKREKEFESLTMDTVMRFAFFLSKWNKKLGTSILTFTEEQEKEVA